MFYVRPFEALAFYFRGRFKRGVLCVCGRGWGEAEGRRGRTASRRKDAQEILDIQYMLDIKQGRGVVRANEQALPLPSLARFGGGRGDRGG